MKLRVKKKHLTRKKAAAKRAAIEASIQESLRLSREFKSIKDPEAKHEAFLKLMNSLPHSTQKG